jgi:hypothetical protein
MPEELGKIEKPAVEGFKGGRKLYFVPMIISAKELPLEFVVKIDRFWDEVDTQISNLESKLGPINRIYHELTPDGGEGGLKVLNDMNMGSHHLVQSRVEKGAVFEATEDNEILAELMDWSRCLQLELQSQKVFSKIYEFYTDASKRRDEHIAKILNETLKDNEIGIVIMSESHHVQFPSDINIIYVVPPALDEIKRWLRDYEEKFKKEQAEQAAQQPEGAKEP